MLNCGHAILYGSVMHFYHSGTFPWPEKDTAAATPACIRRHASESTPLTSPTPALWVWSAAQDHIQRHTRRYAVVNVPYARLRCLSADLHSTALSATAAWCQSSTYRGMNKRRLLQLAAGLYATQRLLRYTAPAPAGLALRQQQGGQTTHM